MFSATPTLIDERAFEVSAGSEPNGSSSISDNTRRAIPRLMPTAAVPTTAATGQSPDATTAAKIEQLFTKMVAARRSHDDVLNSGRMMCVTHHASPRTTGKCRYRPRTHPIQVPARTTPVPTSIAGQTATRVSIDCQNNSYASSLHTRPSGRFPVGRRYIPCKRDKRSRIYCARPGQAKGNELSSTAHRRTLPPNAIAVIAPDPIGPASLACRGMRGRDGAMQRDLASEPPAIRINHNGPVNLRTNMSIASGS